MNLKKSIEISKRIAEVIHGKFYMTHVQAVVDGVEPRLKPIAYLHDVFEQSNVSLDVLKKFGFADYIIKAVDLLTHRRADTYLAYCEKLADNPDALAVKLSDIAHNKKYRKLPKHDEALALFKKLGKIS